MGEKEEPNGALVVTEGLAPTVIDSQVLLHAARMRAGGIVDFSVVVLACGADAHERSLARSEAARHIAGGEVIVMRGARTGSPGSIARNARILERALSALRRRPAIVHARTDYAAAVCSGVPSRKSFALVWDCRGDSAAEASVRYGDSVLRRGLRTLAVRVAERRARIAHRASDGAIFVTRALRELFPPYERPSAIIPCLASSALFRHDPVIRAVTRERLGFAPDDVVVVYSGSLTPYQCLPESIELVQRTIGVDPKIRFLILTPDVERARAASASLAAVTRIVPARLEEVNAYLNAADVALLLRRDEPLNRSAFPTKFAEYCLSGLPVIVSRTLRECREVAFELGLGLDPTPEGTIPVPLDGAATRAGRARMAAQRLSAEARVTDYAELYGASLAARAARAPIGVSAPRPIRSS